MNVSNNVTIGGTLKVTGATTLDNKLTVSAGGLDVTGASDFRNSLALHGHDITGAGTISGILSSAGNIDMNNHNINSVNDITAGGTIFGTIDADSGYNSDVTVKGSDGNDCKINIAHGIVTGTTCP